MDWTKPKVGRARPSEATLPPRASRVPRLNAATRCPTRLTWRARRSGRLGEPSLPARTAILLVKLYQKLISPWLGQRCRFHPSCSNYCIDALHQHGMVLGLWLGVKRICKCHPFHSGGFDPVPKKKIARSSCGFPPQRTPGNTGGSPPLPSVNSSEASGE